MKDIKGVDRKQCLKPACECEEYMKEKDLNLCSYCDHTPLNHAASTVLQFGSSSLDDSFDDVQSTGDTLSLNETMNIDITATTSITESPPVTAGPSFSQLGDINDTETLESGSPSRSSSTPGHASITPRREYLSSASRSTRAQRPANSEGMFPDGLKAVLESCTDGMMVLQACELTYHLRNKLAGVVVNHVIQYKRKKGEQPKNDDLARAADAVLSLFPSEKLDIWYTPPKTGNKKIAGGKLTEKYRNTWRLIREFDRPAVDPLLVSADVDEESVADDLNWLKYNMQPWVTVLQKWERTALYRLQSLQSGSKTLKDYKLYADRRADSLVNIDFRAVCQKYGYADCSNKLFEMWPGLMARLQNPKLQAKVKDLDGNDDERTVKLLIHLSCSKRSVRLAKAAKRKAYCPSLTDCQNSFVIFAQNLEEGERMIEYMRSVYKETQLNLQPLVISEPSGTVVVYDDYRLLSESLVKGIDLCFKLIQVLHLEYNVASYPMWLFLQQYVYGVKCLWDIPSPKAAELAKTLGL